MIRKAVNETFPRGRTYGLEFHVQYLAENGQFKEAETMADELKDSLIAESRSLMFYWYALGSIEYARGNFEDAVKKFEKSLDNPQSMEFPYRFMLARACQMSGQKRKAIDEFEKALTVYNQYRLNWSIWCVKTYYYLGLLYEEVGQYEDALTQYEQFTEFWKDADPGTEELDDARNRIKKLQSRM